MNPTVHTPSIPGKRRFSSPFRLCAAVIVAAQLALIVPAAPLRSQPVTVPTLNNPGFNDQDFQPLFDAAAGSTDAGGWEYLISQGRYVLQARWEAEVNAEIEAEVLGVTQSDDFNTTAEYRDYLRKALLVQKEDLRASWELAAEAAIERERREFQDRRQSASTQTGDRDTTAALNSATQAERNSSDASSYAGALEELRRRWENDFEANYAAGLNQYRQAENAVQSRYAEIIDALAQAESEFQSNLASIEAYETRVRDGMRASVTDARSYVNGNGLYHVESCSDSACNVDMNTLNASGQSLLQLLNDIEQGLDDNAPLSLLGQQMTTFLQSMESQAQSNVSYWSGRSDGQVAVPDIHYLLFAGFLHAGRPVVTWNNSPYYAEYEANGDSPAGLEARKEHWSNIASDGIAHAALTTPGNEKLLQMWNYLRFGGIGDAHQLIRDLGDNRTVRSIDTADLCGHSPNRQGHYIPDYVVEGGNCFSDTGGNLAAAASLFTYRTESGERWVVGLENQITLKLTYTWEDSNAIANTATWTGYENDISPFIAQWQDVLLPAIRNWETQSDQYAQSYAVWQLTAAQQQAEAETARDAALTNLARERNEYSAAMQASFRKGNVQFDALQRDARSEAEIQAGLAAIEGGSSARRRSASDTTSAAAALNAIAVDRTAAQSGLPDVNNLQVYANAFNKSLMGAQNHTTAVSLQERSLAQEDRYISLIQENLEQHYYDSLSDDELYDYAIEYEQLTDYEEQVRVSDDTALIEEMRAAVIARLRQDAEDARFTVAREADGTVSAVRKIKTGDAYLRLGGDALNQDDYIKTEEDQTIRIAPPQAVKLVETPGIFDLWDDETILEEHSASIGDFWKHNEQAFENVATIKEEAETLRNQREILADNAVQQQVQAAEMVKALATGMIGGASFAQSLTKFFQDQLRGKVVAQFSELTGIPAGFLGPLLGGATFEESVGAFAESVMWDNIQTHFNIPSVAMDALQSWTGEQLAKKAAKDARNKAGQIRLEDVATFGATYMWRNAQHHRDGAVALQVVETVVGVAASILLPGVGTAAYMGYMAAKQTYNGSLEGGTKGALAGLASAGVNAYTSKIGLNVGLNYTFEGGYGGSVGLGIPLSEGNTGANLGLSAQFQEGQGLTGYGASVGYNHGSGWGGSLGFNWSTEGGFQGASLSGGYTDRYDGGSTNYSGSMGFGPDGHLNSVGANISDTTYTDLGPGYTASHTLGGGLTYNFDGSFDVNLTQSAGLSDATRFGFSGASAGQTSTFHFDGGLQSVKDNQFTGLEFQTMEEAEANIIALKADIEKEYEEAEQAGDTEKMDELRAKYEELDVAHNKANVEKARAEWAADRLKEAGYSDAEIAEILSDPELMKSDEFRKLLASGDENNAAEGTSRDGWLSETIGAIGDGFKYLAGMSSSTDGFVDDEGNYHERTCFVAGTLIRVHMNVPGAFQENGKWYKRIESMREGDLVLSWNEATGAQEFKKVARTFSRTADQTYRVTFSNGENVEATEEHPIFVIGKGWTAVRLLRAGDIVQTEDGVETGVKAIDRQDAPATVYNFEVEANHNYFVSPLNVLVHNKCVLLANKEDARFLLESMQKLTDDKLELAMDESGFYKVVVAEEGTGDKEKGTQLIREIIENQERTVTIGTGEGPSPLPTAINLLCATGFKNPACSGLTLPSKGGSEAAVLDAEGAEKPSKGSDTFIWLDKNDTESLYVVQDTETGSVRLDNIPIHLTLGGELIHAHNNMTGYAYLSPIGPNGMPTYSTTFLNPDNSLILKPDGTLGTPKTDYLPLEEARTHGVPACADSSCRTWIQYQSRFTDQDLWRESGLGIGRVQYFGIPYYEREDK